MYQALSEALKIQVRPSKQCPCLFGVIVPWDYMRPVTRRTTSLQAIMKATGWSELPVGMKPPGCPLRTIWICS